MIPGFKTEFDQYTPDEMRELYKINPGRFDKLAAEAIKQACISETPEETLKLQQMQRTIDAQLQKAKTQLERTAIMENIFYSQVFGRDGNLAHLAEAYLDLAHTASEPEKVATAKPMLLLVKK